MTKRLTAKEAQLYQEWIRNDRRIRALLDQVHKVDAKAAELLLKEAVSLTFRTSQYRYSPPLQDRVSWV